MKIVKFVLIALTTSHCVFFQLPVSARAAVATAEKQTQTMPALKDQFVRAVNAEVEKKRIVEDMAKQKDGNTTTNFYNDKGLLVGTQTVNAASGERVTTWYEGDQRYSGGFFSGITFPKNFGYGDPKGIKIKTNGDTVTVAVPTGRTKLALYGNEVIYTFSAKDGSISYMPPCPAGMYCVQMMRKLTLKDNPKEFLAVLSDMKKVVDVAVSQSAKVISAEIGSSKVTPKNIITLINLKEISKGLGKAVDITRRYIVDRSRPIIIRIPDCNKGPC